jgi:hypothetical protein
VTGTLTNTAAVFAPLVGGATVALATGIDAVDAGGLGAGATAGADALGGAGGVGDPGTVGAEASGTTSGAGAKSDSASALSVPVLGQIVGAYVLILAALLTALATGLERGFDRTLVAYRVGIALPTAAATYLVAFLGAGLLL